MIEAMVDICPGINPDIHYNVSLNTVISAHSFSNVKTTACLTFCTILSMSSCVLV